MIKIIVFLALLCFQIASLRDLKKRKISFFAATNIVIGCIFTQLLVIKPRLLQEISALLGFQIPSNLVFLSTTIFLGILTYNMQIRLNRLETRLIKLAQKIALNEK